MRRKLLFILLFWKYLRLRHFIHLYAERKNTFGKFQGKLFFLLLWEALVVSAFRNKIEKNFDTRPRVFNLSRIVFQVAKHFKVHLKISWYWTKMHLHILVQGIELTKGVNVNTVKYIISSSFAIISLSGSSGRFYATTADNVRKNKQTNGVLLRNSRFAIEMIKIG